MIKVNVISGFLGAGKTTFIKQLAAALTANNEKLVILENEFGEVGIDGKTLELDGLTVLEIASGCICCTLKNDFMNTLLCIADKISPDRIIIEPSGIFVPSEIEGIFKNPQVSSRLTLCSSVTVVDSLNFLKQRHQYGYFFENQISCVDKLILSKTKDIDPDTIVNIIRELQNINPKAEIIACEWKSLTRADFISLLSDGSDRFDNNHVQIEHSHTDGSHGFMAFGLFPAKEYTVDYLGSQLSKLADESCGSIVRAKGQVYGTDGIVAFDYVNGDIDIRQIDQNLSASVCFIGENLDKNRIASLFE